MANSLETKPLIIRIIGVIIGLVIFAIFIMPPLYRVICAALGINGYVPLVAQEQMLSDQENVSRMVNIQFISQMDNGLNWDFAPEQSSIKVNTGDSEKVLFTAKNHHLNAVTVQAIPSISPTQAAPYFKKVECFCFTQQRLEAHAEIEMPVIFYLEPNLPEHIKTITLSYALIPIEGGATQALSLNQTCPLNTPSCSVQVSSSTNASHLLNARSRLT